jgi:hypothetical protein
VRFEAAKEFSGGVTVPQLGKTMNPRLIARLEMQAPAQNLAVLCDLK